MSVLEVKNLTHTYSGNTPFVNDAVSDVSFAVEKGEIIGIIGHTGSGKSTLVQHLNGLLKPTEGEVFIDGENIWDNPKEIRKIRSKVGLVFQYPEYQLFEETVYKDVAFGPKNMGLSEVEIDKTVREAISFVGLDETYLDKSPFDLSGGEKRRVAIAGVMAMKPSVLILDEPCAGLDPKGRNLILSLIEKYRALTESTVIVVSHSMEDISKIASKILVMNNSRLAYYDTVSNVFSHAGELREMGLNIPQITQLFINLKKKGYDVRTDIYNIEDAKKELLGILKGGSSDVK